MKDKLIKTILGSILLSGAIYVIAINSGQLHWVAKKSSNDYPQVPFEVVDSIKSEGVTPLHEVKIFLSPENYSKDSIESIFQWYLDQKKVPNEAMTINVYTDKHNLLSDKLYRERILLAGKGSRTVDTLSNQVSRWPLYDAFFRCGNGLAEEGTGIYTYAPDLKLPNETVTVTINKKQM